MKAALQNLTQPSLARRVVLALMFAFLIVWCVLIGIDYWSFKAATLDRRALRSAAKALVDSLVDSSDTEAAMFMKATEIQFNRSRRDSGLDAVGDLMFSLAVPGAGKVLYASRGLAGMPTPPDAGASHPISIGGRAYWSVQLETARWRLLVLEPVVSEGQLLGRLNRQQLEPMLVAFPLVLLPLWWAVRRGLLPLRELAARIAARDTSDVSPLGLGLRYAELRPLVAAFVDAGARRRRRAQAVNLVEVTRQVLIATSPSTAERGMEVSLDSPDSLHASIDLESFHTIVDNLLRNALSYCHVGARVEVQLALQGQRLQLAVRDDGPGVPAGDVPQIFERFCRGRSVHSSGSGLGLAIVRHAAQALGGTVALQSGIDGRGAGFYVEFPVDEAGRRGSHNG